MEKKIKKFFVDGYDSIVYAISLVDAPAIESDFMTFSKTERKPMAFESNEKRMVVGPVLIPNLPIYRYDEFSGMEYYIEFGAKAIEQLSRNFFRTGQEFTLDHERFAPGVYLSESWLKSDMEKDKSVALGLDPELPVGTWFVSAYVDSEETWEQVKSGKWAGFSVESLISMVEEQFKKDNKEENMKEQTFIDKLKSLFNEYFKEDEEPKQEEVQLEEAVEAEEQAQLQEENTVEEPVQTELEEQTAAEAQQEEVELAEDDTTEEEPEAEEDSRVADLEARIAELEAQLADVLDRLAAANLKVQEMSKQPSAKPVNVKAGAEGKTNVMDTIRALREGTYFKN